MIYGASSYPRNNGPGWQEESQAMFLVAIALSVAPPIIILARDTWLLPRWIFVLGRYGYMVVMAMVELAINEVMRWMYSRLSHWQGPLNDLWLYRPSTNQWTWMDGKNDTFSQGNRGTLGVESEQNQMPARAQHGAFLDRASGLLYLFGGTRDDPDNYPQFNSIDYWNDMWRHQASENASSRIDCVEYFLPPPPPPSPSPPPSGDAKNNNVVLDETTWIAIGILAASAVALVAIARFAYQTLYMKKKNIKPLLVLPAVPHATTSSSQGSRTSPTAISRSSTGGAVNGGTSGLNPIAIRRAAGDSDKHGDGEEDDSTISTMEQMQMSRTEHILMNMTATFAPDQKSIFVLTVVFLSSPVVLAIPAFLQYQKDLDFTIDHDLSEGGGGKVSVGAAKHPELIQRAGGKTGIVVKQIRKFDRS